MENSGKRGDYGHRFTYSLENCNCNLGINFDTCTHENLGLYRTFILLFVYQHAWSDSLGKYIRKAASCSSDNYFGRISRLKIDPNKGQSVGSRIVSYCLSSRPTVLNCKKPRLKMKIRETEVERSSLYRGSPYTANEIEGNTVQEWKHGWPVR